MLGFIADANPPEQVKSGLMTMAQWAELHMSDEPGGYLLARVHPAALFLPTPTADGAKVREYSRLPAETAPPVVVDSNEKIQARFNLGEGGRLDQTGGLQPYTLLDGSRRVEATLSRGDAHLLAYVPRRQLPRVLANASTAELHDFAHRHFDAEGYRVLVEGERQWLVVDRRGRQRELLRRDILRIARSHGHRFFFRGRKEGGG